MATQQAVVAAPAQQVQQRVTTAKQAIVVGAGPGGVLSAAALAKRGYLVRVFEKRRDPTAVDAAYARTFSMAVNGRALLALQAAGLETETVAKKPYRYVAFNRKVLHGSDRPDPMRTMYFLDRLRLGQELVQAARKQTFANGGSIEWHFGQALEDVDFENRKATFVPASTGGAEDQSSSRIVAEYDLLVGADGANSVVRSKMAERLPEVRLQPQMQMLSTYKTFHGLEVTPAVEKALPGITAQQPGDAIYFFRLQTPSKTPAWGTLRKQADGTCSGSMTGPLDWFDDAKLQEQVDTLFGDGLDEWRAPVYAQTCSSGGQEPSRFSTNTKVSQFHGPSCVLVGDAAHPVTPSLGQGCNAALESARVFAEVLDKVGLEDAPAAFTAARVRDAHAMQEMDCNSALLSWSSPVLVGPKLKPPSALRRMAAMVEMLLPTLTVWQLLKLLAPNYFSEPSLTFHMTGRPQVPYALARMVVRTTGWAVALGVVAVLGALLRLAAGKLFGI